MSRLRVAPPIELWCVDLTAAAPALHAIEQHTPRLSTDDRARASSFSDDDLERIAAQANDTTYGLSAYVWTQNLGIAHKMAKKLKAGSVCINTFGLDLAVPFGGYKQSGWGRENGREGIETYTEIKSVMIGL